MDRLHWTVKATEGCTCGVSFQNPQPLQKNAKTGTSNRQTLLSVWILKTFSILVTSEETCEWSWWVNQDFLTSRMGCFWHQLHSQETPPNAHLLFDEIEEQSGMWENMHYCPYSRGLWAKQNECALWLVSFQPWYLRQASIIFQVNRTGVMMVDTVQHFICLSSKCWKFKLLKKDLKQFCQMGSVWFRRRRPFTVTPHPQASAAVQSKHPQHNNLAAFLTCKTTNQGSRWSKKRCHQSTLCGFQSNFIPKLSICLQTSTSCMKKNKVQKHDSVC